MSVLIVIAFIVLFVACLFMADRLGYNRGIKELIKLLEEDPTGEVEVCVNNVGHPRKRDAA